ncbi:MAG: 50S ribosomal protein L32 [Patescibacteria group bacterium]|nr:50S ribosomal protein L32 [Patescibacteria group bacterium]MDD3777981.1 50S ribosomal protein L32 [Patescibacteria group bacterium]MDD3939195.1 50S ribosomal protein L32 [Patescibacteria group bacterium]MDD4443485.1 50S ribosomal protein L32 [Patescibacteria group bacterium]NCU39599.1 50S ribosomal protein L32 [Candidatus Falkowbacteria bacterium]
MANPKKRKTHSKSRMGRSHLALKKVGLIKCPKCGEMIKPHTACQFCGTYKGVEVIKTKSKTINKK